MSDSTLRKRVQFHTRAVQTKRAALLGIAETLLAAIDEISADRYLSRGEKGSKIARLKNEARRRVDGALADANDALGLARGFTDAELNRIDVTPHAQERIRRLVDQGIRAKQIHDRARDLGDREMLAALRDEIRWGLIPATDDFVRGVERTMAGLAPDGGDSFGELLELIDNNGLKEAQKLVNSAVDGTAPVGVARLRYAYALSDTRTQGDGDAGDGGDE